MLDPTGLERGHRVGPDQFGDGRPRSNLARPMIQNLKTRRTRITAAAAARNHGRSEMISKGNLWRNTARRQRSLPWLLPRCFPSFRGGLGCSTGLIGGEGRTLGATKGDVGARGGWLLCSDRVSASPRYSHSESKSVSQSFPAPSQSCFEEPIEVSCNEQAIKCLTWS